MCYPFNAHITGRCGICDIHLILNPSSNVCIVVIQKVLSIHTEYLMFEETLYHLFWHHVYINAFFLLQNDTNIFSILFFSLSFLTVCCFVILPILSILNLVHMQFFSPLPINAFEHFLLLKCPHHPCLCPRLTP